MNPDDGSDSESRGQEDVRSGIEEIGDGRYRIGSLELNRHDGSIRIPGHVNMDSGMIEVLACAPYGKTHESVFVLDVEPYHVQVALLLLDLKPGNEVGAEPRRLTGDRVEIWLEWQAGGEEKRVRGEACAWNIVHERPMTETTWVFAGSQVSNGVFVAQVEGSLVTTYNDPNSIIDNPLATGSDDTVYRVNASLVPPKGTPVVLEIRATESSDSD